MSEASPQPEPSEDEKLDIAKRDLFAYIQKEETGEGPAFHFVRQGVQEFDAAQVLPDDLRHMLLFYYRIMHNPESLTYESVTEYENYFQGRDTMWKMDESASLLNGFIKNTSWPILLLRESEELKRQREQQ